MHEPLGKMRFIATLLTIGAVVVTAVGHTFLKQSPKETQFGATYSHLYATSLDLDWQEVYEAVLDDLAIEKLRIPLYWSEIEQTDDIYDFTKIDWMMDQAEKRGAKVTLVIGQKVPRWPECYLPDWIEHQSVEHRQDALLDYMQTAVYRYKDHPAMDRWQVENEPFFPFGECPEPSATLVENEIRVVRQLDSKHPIQLTTSGEQSFWLTTAMKADVIGASLYREVWHEYAGYFVFPLKPFFYKWQARIASPFVEKVIISEFQAEPWHVHLFYEDGQKGIIDGYNTFNAKQLQEHIDFALESRVDEVYFWGVEWWYYLKKNGESGLWGTFILNN